MVKSSRTDLTRMRHSHNGNSWFCDLQYYEKNGVRLLAGGSAAVFDHELLELVFCELMSQAQAKEFIRDLFEEFGNLNAVFEASKQRILKVPGSTLDAYLRIRVIHEISLRMARSKIINQTVLSCWDDLILYCRTSMAHKEKEQFRVFFLDKKNSIISDEEQAEGTIDHVPVYPRELAKRALELNAKAIILVHNHPSGDPTPSPEDIQMTRSIQNACETIGVTVHDHIVIGRGKEFSFKVAKCL